MGNICQKVLKIILSFHVKKTRKRLNQKVVCANEGVLQVYSILQLSLLTNAHAVHSYF